LVGGLIFCVSYLASNFYSLTHSLSFVNHFFIFLFLISFSWLLSSAAKSIVQPGSKNVKHDFILFFSHFLTDSCTQPMFELGASTLLILLKWSILHPSVLRFCIAKPYVPLRDTTKRERLCFRSISDFAAFVTYKDRNSNLTVPE
jgi:uncharacterized membrane protein YesL